MKSLIIFVFLLVSSGAFGAELDCRFISGEKELLSESIQLASGEDEEFQYDVKNSRDDFQIEVWTSNGKKISMLILTDNDTKVSAYRFHAMGGEDSMNVNMLIQSMAFELTCHVRH